ncbi:MAG TPA: gamma-glutamyl-gamma-aminobutyrate hydrolase family protein [Roseiflexaceae bacterium]|nr:gamma-glutamyl-gamma-aminobutyrate hydrolase family protein [Roseiflexaceae bacterium]
MSVNGTRPIIGVVGSRYESKAGSLLAGVAVNYLRGVEAGGGVPLLIHLTEDTQVLEALYSRCDALLMTGGGDVDPAQYGMQTLPQCGAPDPLRDMVELLLARRAIADGMPLFGICRGIQLLNVAMGGTLIQDIPSECPGALDHYASRQAPSRAHLAHPIRIEAGSWLAEHLGASDVTVNTFHHQALRDVAPGLRVVARAPDGMIEAVESITGGFVAGVQCHPEDLWEQADPRWTGVFAGFVDVARRVTR